MDNITLRLRPSTQPGMTRLHLSGVISTRLSAKDVRCMWQLIEKLSEQVYVALPVDTPLPWFDLWVGRVGHASAKRLSVRFVYRRHGRNLLNHDGER